MAGQLAGRLAILWMFVCVAWPIAAQTQAPDWAAAADVRVVNVVTHDEDGKPHLDLQA